MSENFYSAHNSNEYWLGDVIEGFKDVMPVFANNEDEMILNNIKIGNHQYYVILTPSCSIDDKQALIAPLKKVNAKLIGSEYLRKDLTLINNVIAPKIIFGDDIYFNKLPPEKREEFDNQPEQYEHLEYYMYKGAPFFNEYELSTKNIKGFKTNYYMVSFKDAFKVEFNGFSREVQIKEKILELSIEERQKLVNKLLYFYSRNPNE